MIHRTTRTLTHHATADHPAVATSLWSNTVSILWNAMSRDCGIQVRSRVIYSVWIILDLQVV